MKKQIPMMLIVASGLITGFLAGRGFSGTRTHASENLHVSGRPTKSGLGRDADSAAGRQASADADRHDFRALLRSSLRYGSENHDELRELERLDSSSLRELMAGPTSGHGVDQADEDRIPYDLMSKAAGVLYRREGEKSLEWAFGLDPGPERQTIFFAMVEAAVAETPSSAKPWVDRVREICGNGRSLDLACNAIISAAGKSAEELLRVREAYGDALDGFTFPQGSYAEDFDFQLLFDKMPSDSDTNLSEAMSYWAAKDWPSAWGKATGEMDKGGENSISYFGSVYTGIAVAEGEASAADWVANHLGEVPAGMREAAVRKLLRYSRPDASADAVMDSLNFSAASRAKVNAALLDSR